MNKGVDLKSSTLHFVRDIRIAQVLLDNGIDINAYTSSGFTALHIAVERNNIAYVEFLLKNGVKFNLRTQKPMHLGGCCNGKQAPAGSTALTIAKILNNKKMVNLLKKYGGRQ